MSELFITGTTTEVVPIIKLDGKPVGSGAVGDVTATVMELYRQAAGIA
jgi:D-alanine transaminase